MPQDRTLLQQADGLTVERVVQHSGPAQWGPVYAAATPRLVLPAHGATEFSVAGYTVMVDGLTMLGLPAGLAYRMKPCLAGPRTSIVVSAQPGTGWLRGPGTWLLAPKALWMLRTHWHALARGDECAGTPALLQAARRAAVPLPRGVGRAAAAVQRARHFMVTQVQGDHPQRWTLGDVSDAACCSAFHLARQFRRHMGLSLHGYRQRLRLATALQRLQEGERDLAALAHELGYSSQSHFGDAFRREIGVTPARARLLLAA